MKASDPRGLAAYRKHARRLKAQRLPCSLCGGEIDYSVKGKDTNKSPWSFVADHRIPIAKGGDPNDPANLAPAHRDCNARKGDRMFAKRSDNSRRW